MAQEPTRLQKLGRQKMPGWLALKVPARLPKLAECNAPLGAVRTHVECHIVESDVDMDAAQRAMQEYRQAEGKREAKMQKLLGSRDALKHRIHDHIQKQTLALQEADSKQKQQYAKRERLQRFNQHVEELRASLKQDLAQKALKQLEDKQQATVEKAAYSPAATGLGGGNSRLPLVTRHAPNQQQSLLGQQEQQQPALTQQPSQIWGVSSCDSLGGRASSAAPQQVVKARILDAKQTALEKKVKEKHVTLPPLCSCPHDLSPLNPQYPSDCAINCPLYQNDPLYRKLLQSLLFNYDLAL
ncbi:Coiled-coil domain containing 15 [Trebouxia sp. C0009 RCD-2024]